MYSQLATVWCGFWAGDVVGSYFFDDDTGNAATVNGKRYSNMIMEFLWLALVVVDLDKM